MKKEVEITYDELTKPSKNQFDEILLNNPKVLNNIKEEEDYVIAEVKVNKKIKVERSISKKKKLKENSNDKLKNKLINDYSNDTYSNNKNKNNVKKEFISSKLEILELYQNQFKEFIIFKNIKQLPILLSYSQLMQKIEYFYQFYTDVIFKEKILSRKFPKSIIQALNKKHSNNLNFVTQTLINILYSANKYHKKYQEISVFLIFIKSLDEVYISIYLYLRYYLKLTTNINLNFYSNDLNFDPNKIEINIINCKSVIINAFKYDERMVTKLKNDFDYKYGKRKSLIYYKFMNFITRYFSNNEMIKILYNIFIKFTEENKGFNIKNPFISEEIIIPNVKNIYLEKDNCKIPILENKVNKEISNNKESKDVLFNKFLKRLNVKIDKYPIKINLSDYIDGDILNVKRIIKKKIENILLCINENNYNKFLKIFRINKEDEKYLNLYNNVKVNIYNLRKNKLENIDKLIDDIVNSILNFKDIKENINVIYNLYSKNSSLKNVFN